MSERIKTIVQRICDWEDRKPQRQHVYEMGLLIAATLLLTLLQKYLEAGHL